MVPGLQVIIVEKTSKLLSKVRISGGGRCNVTHALFDRAVMSRRYPRGQHFVKKTFHQFFTTDTIQWFEERGVQLKAEKDGRMFPVTDSSQTIIDCLVREANRYHVDIRLNAEVKDIKKEDNTFFVHLASNVVLEADFICMACGGYPKTFMFDWIRRLGHTIAEPVPSLFTFNLPGHPITKLMGVSVEQARVKIEGSKLSEEGPVLITHWGLSGPAILRTSAWGARELQEKNYDFRVRINWLPEFNEQGVASIIQEARIHHASRKLVNHNFGGLPSRLWTFLLQQSGIGEEIRIADLPSKNAHTLARLLTDYAAEVRGKTTFKEEFVTAGGITLSEIDPQTMESRILPGIYFAGEVMDVDGITGGFNFQHAWTSGWIAAKAIANQASIK